MAATPVNHRIASCACGEVSVKTPLDPVRVSICHCYACQKRTGSTFAQQARFAFEDIEIDGSTKVYTRTADSGNQIHFHFCEHCATVMYYHLEADPTLYAVPVGVFADADFPAPDYSVYEERMHKWVALPDDMGRVF